MDFHPNGCAALFQHIHLNEIEILQFQQFAVSGALNSVRESYNRSVLAKQRVDFTSGIVRQSELVRSRADEVIRSRKAEFDRQMATNEKSIRDLNVTVTGIGRSLVDLNQIVSIFITI